MYLVIFKNVRMCLSGCTFGIVYVPCIYSHARWGYRRRFGSLLLCPLSIERYYFPLFVDSNERRRSNRRDHHSYLTLSVLVELFHICADWLKVCLPPAERERVLNSASNVRRVFGPLAKYLRTCHTLRYLTARTKSQHRKHSVAAA